ncbi:UNVERIFIED_ORG: hypothetical protein J2W16_003707 [Pseudomonas cremoricolorata]|nr:hypothetical protein [Pseudomonas cremoricolorata]
MEGAAICHTSAKAHLKLFSGLGDIDPGSVIPQPAYQGGRASVKFEKT